ncbi:MAG: putative ABC transporter permease subunit [Bacillota bacterium]
MRSHLWPLLKVQFKTSLRTSLERMTGTNSKWGLLILPLFALGFIPMVIMFTVGWAALYVQLRMVDQAHTMLTLALSAGQLICLAFGVLYVISVFYFSKDLKILLPLPIRPGEIVLAKFIGVLLGEYLTMGPVVLPAFLVYGLFADVGPLYLPFALVIYLLLPVVPLVVASLFTMVMMRVTNLRRNRDVVRVLGALLGIGLALTFQFFSRMQQGRLQVEDLVTNQIPLINSVNRFMFTSNWATEALRADALSLGIPPFLLYVGVVGVALYLLISVAERTFFGGLIGSEETRSSGRRLTREELTKETERVQSPLWAIFLREVRLLNRNPSFLMAAILPPLMVPFFTILPLTQAGGPLEEGSDLSRYAHLPWVPVLILGVALFINSLSTVASSAISREGRWFWISRSLPVAPRLQVMAKLLHSLLFNLLNLAVIVGVVIWFRLVTPLNLAVVLVGGVLTALVNSYSGLLIDVIRPNLTWTDPQQAMKANINGVFAMLLNLMLGGLTGLAAALIFWLARPLLLPGLLVLLAVEAWLLGRATGALAERRFMEYEY